MTVYAARRAGSVVRDLSAGRVTERSRLPCFRSGRCRPAASRRLSPEPSTCRSGLSGSPGLPGLPGSWSDIGELLSWLYADTTCPVCSGHRLLSLRLNHPQLHSAGGCADLDLSLIHISEPTRRTPISYAVFCLKKKNINT